MTGWRIGFTAAPKHVVEAMAHVARPVDDEPGRRRAGRRAGGDRRPERRARDDARRVRQRPRGDGRSGCARSPASRASSRRARSTRSPICRAFVGKKTPEGKTIDDDVQLCEYLLEAARVAVVPGSAFSAPGFVRLSYATSMKNVEEGVRRIHVSGFPITFSRQYEAQVEMSFPEMLNKKIVSFKGNHYTARTIIDWYANKAGGAHYATKMPEDFVALLSESGPVAAPLASILVQLGRGYTHGWPSVNQAGR